MTYTPRTALTEFSWFINVNVIKRNKVSRIKSWLAFPMGGVESCILPSYSLLSTNAWQRQKKTLYTIWKIIWNPLLHKYKYIKKRQHNSLHIGKEKLQNYTVCLKRHQFNQKDLFPTYGRRKIIINGVKSMFISFTSQGKNAGKKGGGILLAYVFLVENNVGKSHFPLI